MILRGVTVNKEKNVKRKILPGAILVSFLAALGTFFLLLNMEKNALSAYEKTYVWCAKGELAKGLEMTEAGLLDCFEQVEVDKSKVPEGVVEYPEELVGTQTQLLITRGTIITESMFNKEQDYVSGLYNPVVAGCKSDDLFQLVSGVLRKGDLVHVYTVNEELEETYLLWENVMVYQAFDSAGNVIASEDVTTPAARINLLLEEGYAEQFYNELNKGSLRVVKVWE